LPLTLSVSREERCEVLACTKLFNKPPLAILNGTSNPIGLNNEHSLFQRISIHLHYDVKASKHLSSLVTTDNTSGKLLIIFILSYLFVLPTSILRIPKPQPHFITGMNANVLHFCSFCKPTFSGATREWDALYNSAVKVVKLLGSRECAPTVPIYSLTVLLVAVRRPL
jgi:hypothetical protein